MNRTMHSTKTINLPLPATTFLGRDSELIEISHLLADPACRLLTLIGPGGIGKTRLAIEAAHQQSEAFANGVYFVALAGLHSDESILPAIAQALRFQWDTDDGGQAQLLDYLSGKNLLLLLDNFEHLLSGAPF